MKLLLLTRVMLEGSHFQITWIVIMHIFRVDHVGIPTLILIVWLIGRSRLHGDSAARLRIAEALGEELCRLELGGAEPRNRLQFRGLIRMKVALRFTIL